MRVCQLFLGVPPMVQDAKHVAVNPADTNAVSRWRESNKAVRYNNYNKYFKKHAQNN